jgi:hypothetical protein
MKRRHMQRCKFWSVRALLPIDLRAGSFTHRDGAERPDRGYVAT